MEAAWTLFTRHCPQTLTETYELADYGCGNQELARLIPATWSYTGYDSIDRGQASKPIDLNLDWPQQRADVGVMLGVLEYLPNNHRVLGQLIASSRYSLFSCNGSFCPLRVWREGWQWRRPSHRQILEIIEASGARLLAHQRWRGRAGLWLCQQPNSA
jgi:hypothetical protein